MSAQPPEPPAPAPLRCPRCSREIGAHQDWCLDCGAAARTRLAATPNWRLPTLAIVAIVALAGAALAFAFVELTDDPAGMTPAGTAPVLDTQPQPTPAVPSPTGAAPTATSTVPPAQGTPPATVPGQTAPAPTPTPTAPSPGGDTPAP